MLLWWKNLSYFLLAFNWVARVMRYIRIISESHFSLSVLIMFKLYTFSITYIFPTCNGHEIFNMHYSLSFSIKSSGCLVFYTLLFSDPNLVWAATRYNIPHLNRSKKHSRSEQLASSLTGIELTTHLQE